MADGSRSSPLKWLALGCLVLVLLLGGCVAGCGALLFSLIKNVEPYQHGVELAQRDPRVTAALGTPVEPGFFPMGKVETGPDSGSAELAIPLSGPQGEGTLIVVATKSGSEWSYRTLRLELEGGSDIDLLEDAAAP